MSLKCRPHRAPSGVPCIHPPMLPGPERLRLPVMTVNGMSPDANGDVAVDLSGIAAETSRAQAAERDLRAGVSLAQSAIADRYTKSETDAKIAAAMPSDYDEVKSRVAAVEAKIPAQATTQNQLADKAFVNSSIATETATFRGTFNLVTDLQLPLDATHVQVAQAIRAALVAAGVTPDDNDYAFVQIPQDLEHTDAMKQVDRYKCTVVGSSQTWAYEWSLNNSSFTAEQWAAINSGITSGAVAKLDALPTAAELVQALAGKQDVLTFDSKPKSGSTNPVTSEGILSALVSSTVVNRDMRNLKVAGLPASGTGYFVFRTGDNFDWAKAEWDSARSIWLIGIAGGGFLGLRTTANPEVYEAVRVDLRGTVTHIQDLDFAISDHLSFIYNGVSYTVFGVTDDELAKVSQLPTVPVQSVNGLTGAVVLTGTDIPVDATAGAQKINAALAGKLGNSGNQSLDGQLIVNKKLSIHSMDGDWPSYPVELDTEYSSGVANLVIKVGDGQTMRTYRLPLPDREHGQYYLDGIFALAAPNPTAGNLAALDASGNPVDSGVNVGVGPDGVPYITISS